MYSESLFGAYHFGWSGVRTVTDGRYRLVRAERDELYDLSNDRAAEHDIAADRPAELDRLRAALDQIVADDRVTDPAPERAAVADKLAVLGYVAPAGAVDPDPLDADRSAAADRDRRDLPYRRGSGGRGRARRRDPAGLDGTGAPLPAHRAAWRQLGDFATTAGRLDRAVDAYRRAATLRPGDADDHLAAARALLRLRRLDEAAGQAELALAAAVDDRTSRAAAHELLARIALGAPRSGRRARTRRARPRGGTDACLHRRSSKGGSSTTPTSSKKRCSRSRAAIAEIDKSGAQPLADLHYYAGDALVRLERPAEAEYHLAQELRAFPHHVRARGALAALYHETGRDRRSR